MPIDRLVQRRLRRAPLVFQLEFDLKAISKIYGSME